MPTNGALADGRTLDFPFRVEAGGSVPVSVILVVLCLTAGQPAMGQLSPDSPVVRQAVERGLAFLEKPDSHYSGMQIGAWALNGLAMIKAHRPANHPVILEAAREISQRIPQSGQPQDFDIGTWDIYSTGLSLIFLCTYDPQNYRREIQAIMDYLLYRQKPHGGWGYPPGHTHAATGDTSQTQYAVLGLWEAIQAGFSVPSEPLNRVALWLLRTQDPSGGYGYQGQVAPGPQLIPQNSVRIGMAVAGVGSAYVLASLLDRQRITAPETDLPPALQRIDNARASGRLRLSIDPVALRACLQRGNAYIHNNFKIPSGMYNYYYLYTLERYFTFRELVDGPGSTIPGWYEAGADFILKTQNSDGSWNHQCGPVPDTAFAILFLVRSTKQSIERVRDFGPGVLVGARGLPKETDNAIVKNGQVVALPLRTTPEDLIAILNSGEKSQVLGVIEALESLPPQQVRLLVSDREEQLRRLAASDRPEAKIAALTALGRSGDLRNAPVLIFALNDPNPEVVLAADRALRRLSRRFEGGLRPNFSETERQAAVEKWKAWYRQIDPTASFD